MNPTTWRIIDSTGAVASYEGNPLTGLDPERAEIILWLLNRNAVNGPFVLLKEAA